MPKFIEHNALDKFPLDKDSVKLVVTSPPYYNLRNYRNDPRQIGLEKTPQEYADKMAAVGRNIKEVLSPDGSYFLNIGDTFDNKTKCLLCVPHRVAIAMIDDGWILRNTIIWHKPNHMPCSIKDKLTPSYEFMFHFVKTRKYYYDLNSIRIPHETIKPERFIDNAKLADKLGFKVTTLVQDDLMDVGEVVKSVGYETTKLEGQTDIKNIGARWGFNRYGESLENRYADGGKNPGDVYFQDTAEYLTPESQKFAEDKYGLIKGGISRPSARLRFGSVGGHPLGKNPGDVELSNNQSGLTHERDLDNPLWFLETFETECPSCGCQFEASADEFYIEDKAYENGHSDIWSINTVPSADPHYAMFPPKLVERCVRVASQVGDLVLDPFSGSGTTAIVAEGLNRKGIGFDIEFNDVRDKRIERGIQTELIF